MTSLYTCCCLSTIPNKLRRPLLASFLFLLSFLQQPHRGRALIQFQSRWSLLHLCQNYHLSFITNPHPLGNTIKWNTKWSVWRGFFSIKNNYSFWIMLTITICLYFNLSQPTFFPFSGREDTTTQYEGLVSSNFRIGPIRNFEVAYTRRLGFSHWTH